MSRPKISINIATWNSEEYIEYCLASISKQTFKDFLVLVIDNGSTDKTLERLKDHDLELIINKGNKGFSKAHNQGIEWAIKQGAEYVLVLNHDVILEPDFLEELIKALGKDKQIASVGGKLLKFHLDSRFRGNGKDGLTKVIKTDILDSTGLKIFKSRHIAERGANEQDQGQYDKQEQIFGLSGAAIVYRLKALEDVKMGREYFDEDFFMYKEDVDLAWRLQLAGWKSVYVPSARAYHSRGIKEEGSGYGDIIRSHQSRSKFLNYHSYKNHLFLLIKNEFISNFLRDIFYIKWYEFRKFVYLSLFERSTLKALTEVLKKLPQILAKRRMIMKKAKIDAKTLRQKIWNFQ